MAHKRHSESSWAHKRHIISLAATPQLKCVTFIGLPLSASAAVAADLVAEFPVFPAVVVEESETTRVIDR
jgi:hypothetical protein